MAFLATGMLFSICSFAQETETEKYVKEVRFYLGNTEDEAVSWLEENGYEPILAETADEAPEKHAQSGDTLVLGIMRTADPDDAIDDLGICDWSSEDLAAADSSMSDEWKALYTVTRDDIRDPILADSIMVRYGDGNMPEGCSRMLTLTPFETPDSDNEAEKVYVFWNTENGTQKDINASSFTDGSYVITATAGLMIGIIGATIFLLPRRKKEEEDV